MSRLSIICLTDPSAVSFAKNCWLCRLIHSCRLPDVPVCPCLDAVICYPALCIKWRHGDLVHTHSVHFVALTSQYFHFVHELLPSKERFLVVITTTTTTLLNQIIIVNGWPTPQIARKKANRGGASQIQEYTY